jgi:hypothetical protein
MKLHLVILFYFIHSFYSLKLDKPINILIDNKNDPHRLDPDNIIDYTCNDGICAPYKDTNNLTHYDIKLLQIKKNILDTLCNTNISTIQKLDIIDFYNDIIFHNNCDSTLLDDWNFDFF